MPKGPAASWLARLSSVASVGKKIPFAVLATRHDPLALVGMGQGSGGFSAVGEAVVASS